MKGTDRGTALLFAAVVILSGCTLGPEYVRVAPDLSGQYTEQVSPGESIANVPFWSFFRGGELQELIRLGLSENRDLARALARIEEARARVGFVRADQFPTLDVLGRALRAEPSNEHDAFPGSPYNDFFIGTGLSFEIDLWGKLRRATAAERADLLATEFGYRAATLALVSEIAGTYLLLLDLDQRAAIAERTIENRRKATALIRSRFQGGIVPELDVHQAEIEEADAVAVLASIDRARRQAENALNVLLGRAPQLIRRTAALTPELLMSDVPAGFPGDLLVRRPDVIAAEERTRAEFERIGVAEAQRLPTLSLLGTVGLNSSDVSDFLDSDALTWDISGGLLGPLFDFGRSRSRVEIARAQAQQALHDYQQTVLVAVREVEDALAAIRTYALEREAREAQRVAASNAARLSRARYDDGVTTYLEVLDIERSFFNAELAVSATSQLYLSSIIRLYAALGGGWQPENDEVGR